METYRRIIKFCYYKVAKLEFDDNGNERLVGKFNLIEWLMNMEEASKVKHNVELSDCVVNLEQYHRISDTDIYAIRAFKLRDANIPSKIKDGETAMPIPLDEDEYIGEDVTFLYDRERSICMMQQNRMSIGVTRLAEWINKMCDVPNGKIAFIPISDQFNPRKIGNKTIKTIEFSFANHEMLGTEGSLGQIISGFNKYNGLTGKIVISVGRDKNAELTKGTSIELIEDLQANPGIVSGAKVKMKSSISDGDKPRIELVDLFENSIHDFIPIEIEIRKPLDFVCARAKMYEKYVERIQSLERLCQW